MHYLVCLFVRKKYTAASSCLRRAGRVKGTWTYRVVVRHNDTRDTRNGQVVPCAAAGTVGPHGPVRERNGCHRRRLAVHTR
jgi:hypothetical protein